LPLSERHIHRRLQDLRAALPGMLEMPVNILNMHNDVLAYFVRPWRPKLGALTSQHNSALGDSQLRMTDAGAGGPSAQTLSETECATEPLDRFLYVFID